MSHFASPWPWPWPRRSSPWPWPRSSQVLENRPVLGCTIFYGYFKLENARNLACVFHLHSVQRGLGVRPLIEISPMTKCDKKAFSFFLAAGAQVPFNSIFPSKRITRRKQR